MNYQLRMTMLVISVITLLTACGAGLSNKNESNKNDGTQPTAQITFPLENTKVGLDVLTVTGIAGDNIGVTKVSVNGISAESTDGFIHWIAKVPVQMNENTLTVSVTDTDGNTTKSAHKIKINNIGFAIKDIAGMFVDTANSRLIVNDSASRNIVAIDQATGAASLLYNTKLRNSRDIINDVTNQQMLVTINNEEVRAIGMGDGTQTTLSTSSDTTGVGFSNPKYTVIDSANSKAYLTSDSTNYVYEIDLGTGVKTIISSPTVGDGDAISVVSDIALDKANARLIVVDMGKAIVEIKLDAPYTRTVLASATVGAGADFNPISLAYKSGKLYALSAVGTDGVIEEINTTAGANFGDRTTLAAGFYNNARMRISNDGLSLFVLAPDDLRQVTIASGAIKTVSSAKDKIGTGAAISAIYGLALSADGSKAWVGAWYNTFTEIELSTGNRTPISLNSSVFVTGVAYDPAENQLYATDQINDQMITYDFDDSAVRIVSSNTIGRFLINTASDAVMFGNDALYAVAASRAIIAVDITSGIRRYLSFSGAKAVDTIDKPTGITVANGTIYVYDQASKKIYSVNAADGVRTLVSGVGSKGAGPNFGNISFDLEADSANNLLFLADQTNQQIFSIDIATGDRQVISSASTGGGDTLSDIADIAFNSSTGKLEVAVDDGRIILSVDPGTGTRVALYDSRVGAGPGINVNDITLDKANSRLIGVDSNNDSIFSVNLNGGERTILWPTGDVAIDLPLNISRIAYDAGKNVVYVADSYNDTIVKVELTADGDNDDNNNISVFSGYDDLTSNVIGEGQNFSRIKDIVLDPDPGRNRLLVLDDSDGEILAVDLGNGNRTVVYKYFSNADASPDGYFRLNYPDQITYDASLNLLYVNEDGESIVELDLATNTGMVISGNARDQDSGRNYQLGWGMEFSNLTDLYFEPESRTLYALDGSLSAIMEVDTFSGDTQAITYDTPATPTSFDRPISLVTDALTQRAYIADNSALHAVDKISGANGVMSFGRLASGNNRSR